MEHTRLLILLFFAMQVQAQYQFKGQLSETEAGKAVYLSIIEDYRRTSRVYLEQIIGKTTADSLGYFVFEGDNLSEKNRIYRIHTDKCADLRSEGTHVLGSCQTTKSILFIANNSDAITLPLTGNEEPFCTLISTNPKSDLLLKIEVLKNDMAFDFSEIHSDASKRLNLKKWFDKWHEFGTKHQEPLAELYIHGFLSDRQNETYAFYLEDLAVSPYYQALMDRLNKSYPSAFFTKLYKEELSADQYLIHLDQASNQSFSWWLYLITGFSLLLNVFFLLSWWRHRNNTSQLSLLSQQEQRIARAMADGKTNKEIAQELFISLSTVKTHVNNIYKKLNISTREDIKSLLCK